MDVVLIMFIRKKTNEGRILATSIKPCHVCPEMQAEEIGLLSLLKRNHLSILLGMNQLSSFMAADISMMAQLRQRVL